MTKPVTSLCPPSPVPTRAPCSQLCTRKALKRLPLKEQGAGACWGWLWARVPPATALAPLLASGQGGGCSSQCPLQGPTQALRHFLSSRTYPGLSAPGRRQLIKGERTLCSGLVTRPDWGWRVRGLAGRAGHCQQEGPSQQAGAGGLGRVDAPAPRSRRCQDLGPSRNAFGRPLPLHSPTFSPFPSYLLSIPVLPPLHSRPTSLSPGGALHSLRSFI